MKHSRVAKMVILMLGLILILSACGSNSTAPAEQTKAPAPAGQTAATEKPKVLTKVKVGIIKIASLTNSWVAKEEGIYEKHGLDVELVNFTNGGAAISAQQSGDLDILLSIPGTAMSAVERGFDLVAIVQNEVIKSGPPDTGSLQVLKDSPIKSVKELAGKKIAISAINSQHSVALLKLLKQNGVEKSQVELLELPSPTMVDALRNKQVDAVAVVDPATTQLQTTGAGKILSWYFSEIMPEAPLGAWYVKRDYYKKNPEIVKAFVASIKDSIDYMLKDENRAREKIAKYTGLDPALVKDMPINAFSYGVKPANWQKIADLMVEGGVLTKPHKVEEEYFSDIMKESIVK